MVHTNLEQSNYTQPPCALSTKDSITSQNTKICTVSPKSWLSKTCAEPVYTPLCLPQNMHNKFLFLHGYQQIVRLWKTVLIVMARIYKGSLINP